MSYRLGLSGILHYDTTGVDSPTWLDADTVEEINLNLETAQGEIKNRSSDWVKVLLGKKNASIEVTMTMDNADLGYIAFRAAYFSGADIGVAVASEDIANNGAEALVADMKVVAMTRAEPLEESQKVTFTLRPSAASATEPAWSVTSS